MTVSVSAQGRGGRSSRQRMIVLGLVGALIALFALANLHLVYVAVHSQPACVDHLKSKSETAGTYRAAKSAC